jgi:hypothetical protein
MSYMGFCSGNGCKIVCNIEDNGMPKCIILLITHSTSTRPLEHYLIFHCLRRIELFSSATNATHLSKDVQDSAKSSDGKARPLKTLNSRASSTLEREGLLSPCSMPTIDLQVTASHKAARIANAEHGRTSVLFGRAELAQHVLRGPVAPALRVLFKQCFHHSRRDVAGRDGVDADAVGSPF